MDLYDLRRLFADPSLVDSHRAVRMVLPLAAAPLSQVLLVQRADITEAVFEGTTAYLTCLSAHTALRREDLLGLPIEVRIVTDQGKLRRIAGFVADVLKGHDDGALGLFQIVVRDGLAMMDNRHRTRTFTNKSPLDIIQQVVREMCSAAPAFGAAFDLVLRIADRDCYPARAMTQQHKESDSFFLRRLMRREGISWFTRARPETGDTPGHQLVLFDDNYLLPEYERGELRCHHNQVVGQRDFIDHWAPLSRLGSSRVLRASYDYRTAWVSNEWVTRDPGLGDAGNQIADALKDARIEVPHVGGDWEHHRRLAELAMQRHEFKARCVHGSSVVRDLPIGGRAMVGGFPELDALMPSDRKYVFIRIEHHVENNLPTELEARANALLTANRQRWSHDHEEGGWYFPEHLPGRHPDQQPNAIGGANDRDPERYRNFFIASELNTRIVPAWDPAKHLPRVEAMTAIVIGPDGVAAWCDEQARVKVRFLGIDPDDDTDNTAWVRVSQAWAGPGFGTLFPLRVGMEVTVIYMDGDPDKPLIVGPAYNGRNKAPHLSPADTPDINPFQSGIVSQEVNGWQQNRLRFDDNTGQISAQLSSDHGVSQVNLGDLRYDRVGGVGEPRGGGAEMTSEEATAVHGGHGLYLSAGQEGGAKGPMLQRDGLLSLSQALLDVVNHLAGLGQAHNAGTVDPQRLEQLVTYLRDWHKGSNVAPEEDGGGAPIIAMNAEAGAGIVSRDNLLLGAQTNIDAVGVRNVQLTAGQHIHQRASMGISQFADAGELRHTIGKGLMLHEVHDGDLHVNVGGQVIFNAGQGIVFNAPTVNVVANGAQTKWGSGTIVEQASGAFQVKSASFAQSGGGDGSPDKVALPATQANFDQQIQMRWSSTGEPMVDQRYRIVAEDGVVLEGRTDASGLTKRFPVSLTFGKYRIEHLGD